MNLVLATDSYKLTHWNQYPEGTQRVYSYFESRPKALYGETVFFGLQPLLRELAKGVTVEDVQRAKTISEAHFGNAAEFNEKGWMHVVEKHGGKLPLRIKAVPEGMVIPVNNVLMTVENLDDETYWLTNAMESFLTHVWYPSTVASLSRAVKVGLAGYLERTADDLSALPFMLHDFGYRGTATHDAAAIGGLGHLVNFLGTDTLPAMELALDEYEADLASLAFSVPATEHSVMTALGREGEYDQLERITKNHPNGILSMVSDSYNIYDFVDKCGTDFKDLILARDGKFVVRPDSVTAEHETPAELVLNLMRRLDRYFGSAPNTKGYKMLNPKVGMIWGDGIEPAGIYEILDAITDDGYSAANMVFGMGGGLLQKVNRDTQRFAFKSCAQMRDGKWFDVYKEPLDVTKTSKHGRLALLGDGAGQFRTVPLDVSHGGDMLRTVFDQGSVTKTYTLAEARENAKL